MSGYLISELFSQEVSAQISVLKEHLSNLKTQAASNTFLEALIQAIHKIQGMAQLVERKAVIQLTESLEDCFRGLLNQNKMFSEDQVDLLLHAGNLILEMSQVRDEDWEKWLSEEIWEINTTEQAIAALSFGQNLVVKSTPIPERDNTPPLEIPEIPVPSLLPPSQPTAIPVIPSLEIDLSVSPENSTMLDLFRLEVEAQVNSMNTGLLSLEINPTSAPDLEALMRAAHSIKGAARIVALDAAVNLAHVMEDCFVAAQNQKILIQSEQIDVLLQGVDQLATMSQLGTEELNAWLKSHQTQLQITHRAIGAILNPDLAVITPIPTLTGKAEEKQPLEVSIPIVTPIPQAQKKPSEVHLKPPSEVKTVEEKSPNNQDRVVRVNAENLNRIMGLAGESLIAANWLEPFTDSLVLLKSRQIELAKLIENLQETLTIHPLERHIEISLAAVMQKEQECLEMMGERIQELEQYGRRTTSLSDRLYNEVITTHMRPFADGIQGFPRMIRDLARQLNKQVTVEITGKATPVDRDILKKLEAPLTHILRNAVDHGLELPEERLSIGKPAEGTIRLEAMHRGGMLSITISDDGRGLDLEKLRAKVIDRGLASKEVAQKLTESELIEFLFLPGFSTAKQVTEISGRGVGLDIAKSMAQDVGGTVRATSSLGKGTSFYFQLPLTLSVIRTLLVEIAGEIYAFPLARIDQIVMLEKSDISVVEGNTVAKLRGFNGCRSIVNTTKRGKFGKNLG